MDLRLEKLDRSDMEELRNALAAEHLPTDDLDEPGKQFYRVRRGLETIGFGGFELHGKHALLRSIVIDPEWRGRGDGRTGTDLLMAEARRGGATHAYLLTETAGPFFERLGFKPVDRSTAPAGIMATRQAASLCSLSAALLAKPLAD